MLYSCVQHIKRFVACVHIKVKREQTGMEKVLNGKGSVGIQLLLSFYELGLRK